MKHAFSHSKASLLSIVLLAAVAAGCNRAEAQATAPPAPVQVQTTKVQTIETPEVLRLTGALRGVQEADLAANVSGRVIATEVERGSTVKKGDVIARVDVQSAALQLAEARAQVETARTQQAIDQVECARYDQLKKGGVVTDADYERVTARCKTAPLTLDAAQARASIIAKNVGDGVIRAPFSGVVTERLIEVGEYVQPSTHVAALADVGSLELEFSVPEANYPSVKVGSDVRFRVVAYGERSFVGKVSRVGGAVRNTRDVLVEAEVANADGVLLPGMFANVSLVVGAKPLPALPPEAVFEQNAKPNAFVVRNGVLEQRVLQVAEPQDGKIPVLQGVEPGEQVVASYRPALKNGQSVR